jgi:hypothetical protein
VRPPRSSLSPRQISARGRVRATAFAAFSCAFGILSAVTCGGTTGREGLTEESDDGGTLLALDAGAPGFVDQELPDTSVYVDASITYVDRVLPDVVAPVTAEAGATSPWPSCPPFIPTGPDGGPVPPGNELDQIPATYGEAGTSIPAAAGSPCATYPWLGATSVDACLTSSASGWGQGDFPLLPPCSWCADAGAASQGPGAGTPAHDLCMNLYTCAMRTGCGAGQDPATCLCGTAAAAACIVAPTGPCATEELAVLQYRSDSVEQALSNYTQIDPAFLGYCGSALNYVFQSARTNGCFALLDAGPNP